MKNQAERRFKAADVDGDGLLEGVEVDYFVDPEYHPNMHQHIVQETLKEIDSNKDGFINFKEYVGQLIRTFL